VFGSALVHFDFEMEALKIIIIEFL